MERIPYFEFCGSPVLPGEMVWDYSKLCGGGGIRIWFGSVRGIHMGVIVGRKRSRLARGAQIMG